MKNTDSDFSALLPDSIRNDPVIRGFSAGFSGEYRRLVADVPAVMPWERLESFAEPVLSLLAYDVNPLLWDPHWSEAVKRAVLRGALRWRMIHGTPACVEEIVSTLLEADAAVIPWWLYDGERGRFRVHVTFSGHGYTEKAWIDAVRAIMRAKNTRSHLDKVILELASTGVVHVGGAMLFSRTVTVYPWRKAGVNLKSSVPVIGAAIQTVNRITVFPYRTSALDGGYADPAMRAIIDGGSASRGFFYSDQAP